MNFQANLIAGMDEAGRLRHGAVSAAGASVGAGAGATASKRGSDGGADEAGESLIAGIDEAGRGCWAGAVYAAAVILPLGHGLVGLRDSKKLSALQRQRLSVQIREKAAAWAVASADAGEVDALNILRASLQAMRRAVQALAITPDECWVDGLHAPALACPVRTFVRGDDQHPAIMAASILAKVARDTDMIEQDARFPGYGFARHKGYGTAQHRVALRRLGLCPLHRRSFAPVAAELPT